jgi:cobalt/nickel transport protein
VIIWRNNSKGRQTVINILLILFVIVLAAAPVLLHRESNFGGTDDSAEMAITEIDTSYRPWFSPVLKLPGGEVESLLFALQAALGAGIVGYSIGYVRGRNKKEDIGKV